MKALLKTAMPQRHVAPRRNDRRLTSQHPRRRFLHLAAGAAALPAVSRIAMAQTYPARPITMVVPYAPGGATDVIARNLVERMKASLGQPVIIENVAGASGTIGTGRVARARPDGYTLGIGHVGTHATNGATFALNYDVVNDFEPVALLSTAPLLFLAKKALPADDLKGLITWLKSNPSKASLGMGGAAGIADRRRSFPKRNRHPLRFRTLSRRRARLAGRDSWANRHANSRPNDITTSSARRFGQGPCGYGQGPSWCCA
jgi:Tripartite tricarboxylate transporter family receptor